MKTRAYYGLGALVVPVSVFLLAALASGDAPRSVKDCSPAGRAPRIHPDYAGLVIPPNIAPLNFCIDEAGVHYVVRIHSKAGQPIDVSSSTPCIRIPMSSWKALLESNRGQQIEVTVYAKDENGQWTHFDPLVNTVADDDIDPYLAYRRMRPWYMKYKSMAIFQRNLTNFDESPIFDTEPLGRGCVNCHSFVWNQPDTIALHFRFPFAMILSRDGAVSSIDTRTKFNKGPFAYTSWHPNGRIGAFSVNKILQVYHTAGEETRDIVDFASDLVIYDLDANTVTTTPAISNPERLETFPAWSHDGRYLYFCRAMPLPTDNYKRFEETRYDFMRIAYDEETGAWGEPETLLRAGETGLSCSMPRLSPDGRFALVCMCRYGTFPIFQADTDLYLLELESRDFARLACNSDRTESWHGWSSNSRWIVFTSKRGNGLFARPHFSHIDERGNASKAFVLPQEDAAQYDYTPNTYSVPEFITGPVDTRMRRLARALRDEDHRVAVQLDSEVQARVAAVEAEAPAAPESQGEQAWPTAPAESTGTLDPDESMIY